MLCCSIAALKSLIGFWSMSHLVSENKSITFVSFEYCLCCFKFATEDNWLRKFMVIPFSQSRRNRRRCSVRKGVLRNFVKFTGKHLCQSLFFNTVAGMGPATLFKKETLAQVFSCESWKISKNIFFIEHLWTTAPSNTRDLIYCKILQTLFSKLLNNTIIFFLICYR